MLIEERYRLVRLVGTGGMGRVWLARDEMLHRDVAVKEVVPPQWLTPDERAELRRRTLREARTAARLSHPNVVRVYDVVHDGLNPWIVMEYVPSRSLHDVLTEDGPLPPRRVAEIGLAVLAALRAAHAAGVLHRDVKPHNVLIGDDGRVVLTDFGLAKFDGGDGATTRPGVILGSPQYVAPERAADGLSSVETDLWSLGATLYAAVEGRAPYARETAMATLTALATTAPDPPRRAGPLRPVLAGLLRRDPHRRLAPAEVERLLRRVRSAPDPAPRRTGAGSGRWRGHARPPHRLGRRTVAALGGLLVLALALGALAWVRLRGEPPGAVAARESAPAAAPSPAGAFPCALPPTAQPISPVASAAVPVGERFALVAGWTWYTDPAGFRVAVPLGWLHYVDRGTVCFREPRGARVLGVDPTTPRTAGAEAAAAHWRARERALTAGGTLAGYEGISIAPLAFYEGAAEWECRWRDAAGETVHTYRLLVNTPGGRAYTISWLTREFDWQVNRAYLPMIRQSFVPAA
ncbi:serine/threonine-protein kinase [Micromonospora sp. NPDC049559]|uniref:serine/threonine-protein kinase n=1 Tax=Micromonospora sp. NPDC049559 TaxID=3155923 RepID=UPI003429AA26